jgi:hypothetical protein
MPALVCAPVGLVCIQSHALPDKRLCHLCSSGHAGKPRILASFMPAKIVLAKNVWKKLPMHHQANHWLNTKIPGRKTRKNKHPTVMKVYEKFKYLVLGTSKWETDKKKLPQGLLRKHGRIGSSGGVFYVQVKTK